MFARTKRTVVSFVAVVAVFWVYRLLAVPLLEPPERPKRVVVTTPEQRAEIAQKQQDRLGGYARFFRPGSWELDNPIVLESDSSKLLLKEYTSLPDGRMQIVPCTFIGFPDGDAEQPDSKRRVIIMQVPQGAILQFDEDVDLSRGKVGQLLGAVLNGPVTVQSAATRPDGSDSLYLKTRDVQLVDNVITTPNEVDFSYGKSTGHGRNMRIELLPAENSAGSKRRGPNFGGIQILELTYDVTMHLQPGSSGLTSTVQNPSGGAAGAVSASLSPGSSNPNQPQSPIDIRSEGPFQFDLVSNVATFHDGVTVLSPNPTGTGPVDQLRNCDLLSVFFEQREAKTDRAKPNDTKSVDVKSTKDSGKKADADGKQLAKPSGSDKTTDGSAPKSRNGGMSPLEARRIEAVGNPVIVEAPSNSLQARCHRLEYDIQAGPENNRVISLVGDAWASQSGQAEIAANALYIWLREVVSPQNQKSPNVRDSRNATVAGRGNSNFDASAGGSANPGSTQRLQPVKMLADGNVRIESPRFSGTVGRMEVWFRDGALAGDPADPGANSGPLQNGPVPLSSLQNRGRGIAPSPNGATAGDAKNGQPTHFDIKHGNLLQAWFVTQPQTAQRRPGNSPDFGNSMQLEHLDIQGEVAISETSPVAHGEKPLEVVADRVQMLHGNEMTIVGRPAQVGARGMTMFGPAVQMDRAANRMWIDGAGRMTIVNNRPSDAQSPQSQQPQSQPSGSSAASTNPARTDDFFSARGTVIVDWQGDMQFDGMKARFQRDVVAQQIGPLRTQTIHTPVLEVTMHDRVDFSAQRPQGNQQNRPQVELMNCPGEVLLESREMRDDKPTAFDQLQVRNLAVNRTTGEMTADGPGRLLGWSLGAAADLDPQGSAIPALGRNPTPRRTQAASAENTANRTVSGVIPTSGVQPVANQSPVANDESNEANRKQIYFVDVQFERGITGNVLPTKQQITFFDQVRAIYGPVATWEARIDSDDPRGLPPRSMFITCDQLTVNQMGARIKGHPSREMEALGNIRLEDQQVDSVVYTAQAHRMTYSEAKDMIVLQGDGRNPAELDEQASPTAPRNPIRGGTINYWRATRHTSFDLQEAQGHFISPPPRSPAGKQPPAAR